MSDIQSEALVLNLRIFEIYNNQYGGQTDNIYCLYSDGGIKYKNGRNEVVKEPTIGWHRELRMEFPNEAERGLSYVILTQEECIYFRNKMINLIEKYK